MALVLEDLRRVRSDALEALMSEEAGQWLGVLGWAYSPTQDFLKTYIDTSSLPGFVLLDGGRAIGYSYMVLDSDRGVLGSLYIARDHWGEGHEEHLASAMTAPLIENPSVQRIEAQLMIFSGADLQPVFSSAGFDVFQRHFLSLNLRDFKPGRPEPDGLELRPWREAAIDEAAHVIYESYVDGIDAHFSSSFNRLDRCRNFVINLVRHHGCGSFLSRLTTVGYVDGKMAGVVIATELSPGVGHLPQISVLPDRQGSGIGAYLVDESLRRFKVSGFSAVSLTVTELNERAEKWYRRLGFAEVLPFNAYLWQRS
jgi:ribosomal protein S18 acetylase RimI-like enzyme